MSSVLSPWIAQLYDKNLCASTPDFSNISQLMAPIRIFEDGNFIDVFPDMTQHCYSSTGTHHIVLSSNLTVTKFDSSVYVAPVTIGHGPQYSSNNAGDGPASTSSSSDNRPTNKFSTIPTYDHQNYSTWVGNFTDMCSQSSLFLIQEKLVSPPVPVFGSSSYATDVQAEEVYNSANRHLYREISHSLQKNPEQSYLSLIRNTVTQFDGIAAWKAIQHFHQAPTPQHKLKILRDLFNCVKSSNKDNIKYKSRPMEAFTKYKAINFTDDELMLSLWINGVSKEYRSYVEQLMT